MAPKPLPAQDVLLQLLSYDPETGKLFWKERGIELFPAKSAARARCMCNLWNRRYAGTEAFTTVSDGYFTGSIFGSNFKAQRVIWEMAYGSDPDQIDHIDGNRSNNRVANLRDVSLAENARNRRVPVNNKSGVIGVYRWQQEGFTYWVATVMGRAIAYCNTFDEAVAARKAAEREHGFHENHGRAA